MLKALTFAKEGLKLTYFSKKLQNLRALRALPPDPLASGGWGRCPQTLNGLLRLKSALIYRN